MSAGNDLARRFLESFAAVLRAEKLSVPFHLAADNGGCGKAHLADPDGDEIGAKLLAVQLHIDEPVVVVLCKDTRVVDKIIRVEVFITEQLFHCKGVASRQNDKLGPVQLQLAQLILKFPLLVVPEDDPATIKFRKRGRKSAVQVLYYLTDLHAVTSLCLLLRVHTSPDTGGAALIFPL